MHAHLDRDHDDEDEDEGYDEDIFVKKITIYDYPDYGLQTR